MLNSGMMGIALLHPSYKSLIERRVGGGVSPIPTDSICHHLFESRVLIPSIGTA